MRDFFAKSSTTTIATKMSNGVLQAAGKKIPRKNREVEKEMKSSGKS